MMGYLEKYSDKHQESVLDSSGHSQNGTVRTSSRIDTNYEMLRKVLFTDNSLVVNHQVFSGDQTYPFCSEIWIFGEPEDAHFLLSML